MKMGDTPHLASLRPRTQGSNGNGQPCSPARLGCRKAAFRSRLPRASSASLDPFAPSPLMIREQDSARIGELRRRVFQRREQEGALVERERY